MKNMGVVVVTVNQKLEEREPSTWSNPWGF
jgi:hypothetical protein